MQENHTSCPSSSEVARKRLHQMKEQALAETKSNRYHTDTDTVANHQRLYNTVPADNNKAWEGAHNKLSSKGD